MRHLKMIGLIVGAASAVVAAGLAVFVAVRAIDTAEVISGKVDAVLATARESDPVRVDEARLAELPEPVRRFFRFTFRGKPRPLRGVRMRLSGTFRRPGAESWDPMTATQYAAASTPAFVFIGETDVLPGVRATAMDAYVDGRMQMMVRIMSAITVVDEVDVPELNDSSLMRFFLEAPLFPTALLPNPHLKWEAIDSRAARAVISKGAFRRSFRVSFDDEGRILRYDAEHRAQANGRFHGAGEHARRADYREVDGVMVPMTFEIARVIDGEIRPFWRGRVERIEFDRLDRFP